ncbi:U32 family peptidase, partial [Candidatus Gracilibacteria bacterium]|nr:U32 family peptidase [Candidatus Gracilibacteria bacterium]
MFQIVAPVKSLKGLRTLAGMGVRNFYGGLDVVNLSGRNTWKAGITDMDELKQMTQYCDQNALDFAYTLNIRPIGHTVSELDTLYSDLKKAGVKNVILNDILTIKKFEDIKVYVSSLAAIYDKNSLDFWSQSHAVKRIILPRELTAEEK